MPTWRSNIDNVCPQDVVNATFIIAHKGSHSVRFVKMERPYTFDDVSPSFYRYNQIDTVV